MSDHVDDYHRIKDATDPHVILNVERNASEKVSGGRARLGMWCPYACSQAINEAFKKLVSRLCLCRSVDDREADLSSRPSSSMCARFHDLQVDQVVMPAQPDKLSVDVERAQTPRDKMIAEMVRDEGAFRRQV
jgi:hypothetical protein